MNIASKLLNKIVTFTLILSMLTGLSQAFILPAQASAVTPKTAVIYGDSLTWESMTAIKNQFAKKSGWVYRQHSLPSTSPCEWKEWLQDDLDTYHPSVVTLISAGNGYSSTLVSNFPNCFVDSNGLPVAMGSDAYYAQYRADLDNMFSRITATGAKVVFAKSPPMLDSTRNAAVIKIANIALDLAGKYHGISISNAVRGALSNSGKYTDYKPCLATETAAMGCGTDGKIAIRTIVDGPQRGLHLCPGGMADTYPWFCNTYSSGEYRYGAKLVNTTVSPPAPILL